MHRCAKRTCKVRLEGILHLTEVSAPPREDGLVGVSDGEHGVLQSTSLTFACDYVNICAPAVDLAGKLHILRT